jgi:hypothetical protein
MPHGFLKDFKSNLSVYAAVLLGKALALAIQQVQKVVLEVLEKLKEACPPAEELERLSQKINNVRKVVNGIEQQINRIRPLPQYLQPTIIGVKVIIDIIAHFPVPNTIGGPGPIGVVYSEPIGVGATRSSKLVKFQKFIESLEDDVAGINLLLLKAQGVMVPILSSLSLIDGLIAQCASRQDLSDEERQKLINSIQGNTTIAETQGVQYTSKNINNLPYPATSEREVLKSTDGSGINATFGLNNPQPGSFQFQQIDLNAGNLLEGGPVRTENLLTEKRPSGNTYLIKVITLNDFPDLAPRRQAIAQDFRGVTVLRGSVSFASRPEVLIEEMKFLIDNRLP